MYHLGKVIKLLKSSDKGIVSADNSVQARCEMWDENQVIVLVHPSLNEAVKENDFVLVRYAQPEPTIIKTLSQKQGKELWEELRSFFEKKRTASAEKMQFPFAPQNAGLEKMIR
ncbi:MAG: hypothetical protein J4224_01725 [Candidatus Diapherotrites archaeon]|uniref:Uncharacterized protein n=1 Tax=Candidatus Iainarchaeum sp. TaxID=3101447 RepID=A0A7J4IZB2_9ARCH|nr:MAG: hypothetical protein QT03_C0001G1302 [archaeon GW2011_AR10]MBS3059124.1 hypothetical protein [Candidatus Diapherotrites archaeon]HIH08306.1 hypothetical protein [Candidatus Diapherotrites archaeon]